MDSAELEAANNNAANGDDELICPLCMELLDETDRNLFPCNCGYQVCLWCLHYIRNTMGNKCPACRQDYVEANFKYINPVTVPGKDTKLKDSANTKEKGATKKQQSLSSHHHHSISTTSGHSTSNDSTAEPKDDASNLKDVRIIQRNLVYVVGIPLKLSKKEILKKYEYFGQYGKIIHIVVNKNNTYSHYGVPSYTAYITYSKKTEAINAIQGINSKQFDNKYLRASYGTTKYCSYFLKGLKCYNNDCYYLHEYGDESDLYVKDQYNSATFFTIPKDKEPAKETPAAKDATTAKETPTKEVPHKVAKDKDSGNTWVNIVNGIKSAAAGQPKEKPEPGPAAAPTEAAAAPAYTEGPETKDEVNNIFNIPIKYCLYKYNKADSIIKLSNVNINKLNSLDTVKKLYQWTYNTTPGGKTPTAAAKEATANGDENVFTHDELYVNDIINKIRRHTMLIDNLSKQYSTTPGAANAKPPGKGELNGTSASVTAALTNPKPPEDEDELSNNFELTLFNVLQAQLKRNENYMNHLKLISSDT